MSWWMQLFIIFALATIILELAHIGTLLGYLIKRMPVPNVTDGSSIPDNDSNDPALQLMLENLMKSYEEQKGS